MPAPAPILLAAAAAAPLLLAALWTLPPARRAAGRLAPWAALPALLAVALVPDGASLEADWLFLGARLGLDDAGRTLLGFTALLWGVGAWYGWRYLADDPARDRFFGFYLAAMGGNFALTLALDAATFYVGFAAMSFASYGLVVHSGEAEARRAGRIYLILVVAGELLLFAGLVLGVAMTGTLRLPVAPDAPLGALPPALVIAGFGIKAGLLPLHVWLPLAHPVAPTPASAVLSGAMIKAGLLGWLRFLPLGAEARPDWGALLLGLGLAGAFFGVAVGVTQRNPKTVLAYSSISQMGLITVALGAGLLAPEHWPAARTAVLLYALHHGLAKGALFLGVGALGAAGPRGARWAGAALLLPALALAGAPFTGGAVAKAALKSAVAALPGGWPAGLAVLLPLAAVGTTLLMARFLLVVWPRGKAAAHPAPGLVAPWAVLLAAVAGALWLWPAAAGSAAQALELKNLWAFAWPVLAGAGAAWAAAAVRKGSPPATPLPAGDLLVPVERAAGWLRRRTGARLLPGGLGGGLPGTGETLQRAAERLAHSRAGDRAEAALRRWPVAGAVLLAVTAAFILLLAQAP